MTDVVFTINSENVKSEMTRVWKVTNKGLLGGDVIHSKFGRICLSLILLKRSMKWVNP